MSLNREEITEAHEIVKTVDVILGNFGTYRVEIVNVMKGGSTAKFEARTYEKKSLYRLKDGSISSNREDEGIEFHVWVHEYLLWVGPRKI